MSTQFFHEMTYVTFRAEESASLRLRINNSNHSKARCLKLVLELKNVATDPLCVEFRPKDGGVWRGGWSPGKGQAPTMLRGGGAAPPATPPERLCVPETGSGA